jgi:hypothetical protein
MDRAWVRTLAIGVTGLIVVLSAPTSVSASKPSSAQKSATDAGWWEQWVVAKQVQFLYVPDHFVAGGDAAYVKVKGAANGQSGIDFEKSAFLQPEAGLKRQHVAPEWEGFYVTIPKGVPTGDYPYRVEFACRRSSPSRPCAGIFYVPVRNDDDQPLLVRPGAGPFHIPVLPESHEFAVELVARKPIYGVRLDPGMHETAGIHSFQLSKTGSNGGASFAPDEAIEMIGPGRPFHGVVRVNRASGTTPAWNYLLSDWRGSSPELPLTFTYRDAYEREWRSQSGPIKFAYQLPPWGVLLYYALLLAVATIAGALGRLAAGLAVGNWNTEARTWGQSMLLAGVLCAVGFVLRARIEPVGLFQLDLTNLRGILAVGVTAGLVPEIIRARLRGLLSDRPAPEASTIHQTGRAPVRRTNGSFTPGLRKPGGDETSDRPPYPHQPPVDRGQLAG